MKMYQCDGYIRISKLNARNRYNAGEVIYVCPEKLRPGKPWFPESSACAEDNGSDFDKFVNGYEYYNCGASAGRRARFYIKESDVNDG